MQAQQRKTCPPVIKLRFFPVFFAMARFAALAQLVLVYVVFRMARDAILRQLGRLIKLASMASNALNLFVLAL